VVSKWTSLRLRRDSEVSKRGSERWRLVTTLELVENYGTHGCLFLDLNVEGERRTVAAICSKVLREVYGVSGDAEVTFQHVGLAELLKANT
jgi:hypothetical protein